MNGLDLIVLLVTGYVSVPVASLLNRKGWPSQLRFLVALSIASLIALAQVAVSSTLTWEAWLAAMGTAFTAQQATFHLEVPGAGTPELNAKLEEVALLPGGEGTEGDAS